MFKSRVSKLCFIYIDIQFRQIPMTAVAVEQYRPAMEAVWLVCGCIGFARLRRRTLVIRESIRKSIGGWRRDILTVMGVLNVDRKYRKCKSKYEKVII